MADWSSLPSELVRRIADCLLATNDLDCYMDLRAVCPNWRSATDDPKDSSELRFRPHRWIIIDEVFEGDSRLLVNTVSGRVVRKDLPLLRRFYVVATTHGGFLVLADKEPPHAARILNPFTGQMILLIAPVPSDIDISAALLLGAWSFPSSLLLLCDRSYERYTADVDSKVFIQDSNMPARYTMMRLYVASGLGANAKDIIVHPDALTKNIFSLMKRFDVDPVTGLGDYVGPGHGNNCFLVKCASQLLVFVMLQQHFRVFAVNTCGDEPEPVKSLGDHAVFVGCRRCVCVTADKFPSVVANCIYYVKPMNSSLKIYKYDLDDEKEELVSEAIESLDPVMSSFASRPFTIVQLLSSYTTNVRVSQLPKEELQIPAWFHEVHSLIKSMDVSPFHIFDPNSDDDELYD